MSTTVFQDITYLSKQLYLKGYKDKDLYRKKPLLMAATKVTDFASDKGYSIPADSNLGNGVGGTIAGAVFNASASTGAEFNVKQANLFGYIEMDSRVVRNAKASNDNSRVFDYVKKQYADGIETLMFEVSRQAYGSGTGARAKVLSASGSTITVAPHEAIFIRKGMRLYASSTDGGALASGTPGYTTVVNVDTSTGTITVDGTVTTQITGIGTPGFYLYLNSIASNNGTGQGGFIGLGGWNPITVTSSLFWGVDRTVNPSVLGGCRYTAGGPLETLFIRAEAQASTEIGVQWEGGDIYLHPQQFAAFLSAKEGVKEISTDEEYKMGIKKLSYKGYTLIQDVCCPLDWAHVVGDGAFLFLTCGQQPKFGDPFEPANDEKVMVKANLDGNFGAHPSRLQRIAMPSL